MNDWFYQGKDAEVVIHANGVTVTKLRNATGDGMMTIFPVMDGVSVMYNDFHMSDIHSEFEANKDVLCLDHCREGRIEQLLKPGVYCYTGDGDLKIDTRKNHSTDFFFPLAHYHGITITLELTKADACIRSILPDFPFTVHGLREKFKASQESFFIRKQPAMEHIFAEMYHVPQSIQTSYLKIKVLELLLWLGALDIPRQDAARPYFYKEQTEKVKAVRELIASDLKQHYTVEQLSYQFDLSATTLKNCFSQMFGSSIYAYLKALRMNHAATLLKTTEMSVTQIANDLGYENPSKFSSAFMRSMKLTPLEYRKTDAAALHGNAYGAKEGDSNDT